LNAGPNAPKANLPTIVVESDNEVQGVHTLPADQTADTPLFKMWEVAGSAHTPVVTGAVFFAMLARDIPGFKAPPCTYPVPARPIPWGVLDNGPVLSAAVHHLDVWVRTGKAAPSAPRVETGPPQDGPPGMGGIRKSAPILRDEFGNAKGGIRLPEIDAPIMRHIGSGNSGDANCGLLYGYDLFDGNQELATTKDAKDTYREPANPKELYGTHAKYVAAYTASARKAVAAGFMLKPDADRVIAAAEKSDVAR
jgi:hypothetical protein